MLTYENKKVKVMNKTPADHHYFSIHFPYQQPKFHRAAVFASTYHVKKYIELGPKQVGAQI